MAQVLQGLDDICFQDDILATSPTREQHWQNLRNLLQRLRDYGFKANQQRSKFFQSSVMFLGHVVGKEGLHKTSDKVQAVVEAPKPSEVNAAKGMATFIQLLCQIPAQSFYCVTPLYKLLQNNRPWQWSDECEKALIDLNCQLNLPVMHRLMALVQLLAMYSLVELKSLLHSLPELFHLLKGNTLRLIEKHCP
ncbi:hypothetical protein PR048_016094 [Dryococelus australis]|uniref:Reverse transcriptase domain-containing protein n=1 Tax=Dryococelus australis TaxID=614101 RepID=A0ABQ9HIT0_9NEOP|nr:hypothetical protein PR048_016094 [Dryococelus australis]